MRQGKRQRQLEFASMMVVGACTAILVVLITCVIVNGN